MYLVEVYVIGSQASKASLNSFFNSGFVMAPPPTKFCCDDDIGSLIIERLPQKDFRVATAVAFSGVE